MWIFAGIAIFGFFLNMNKQAKGYIVWFISNIGFLSYNLLQQEYAQSGLWLFYSFMCVYGYWKWQIEEYRGKPIVVMQKRFPLIKHGINTGDLSIIDKTEGEINKGDLGIIIKKDNDKYWIKPFKNKKQILKNVDDKDFNFIGRDKWT